MPGFIDKNRKFFIILSIFLLLFWLVTLQVKAGRFTVLEKPVLAVSGFFGRIITGVYDFAEAAVRGYVFLVRTERENRRLHSEVAHLRLEKQLANELLAENERLRDALEFQRESPRPGVTVHVIAKDTSSASSTFTVNKGSLQGLDRDLPVITSDGIVGRINAVLPETSKIQLITDPGSVIAVRVQRNREEGLLEGKLDRCALKYVSYYMDVQKGDVLISSGLDGIYPKGLPVAVVTSVRKRESSSFQTVFADPVVSFSRIEEALVLRK